LKRKYHQTRKKICVIVIQAKPIPNNFQNNFFKNENRKIGLLNDLNRLGLIIKFNNLKWKF